MLTVSCAPSKTRFLISKGLHLLPLIGSFLRSRDMTRLTELARRSAERKQDFSVLHSGWARKIVAFDTKNVRARLENIDRITGLKYSKKFSTGMPPSSHWSRIYEYPYAAYQLRSIRRGSRVLDCGCDLASFQFYLAEQGFEVHGIDIALKNLERVATLKEQLGLPNLKPTFGNLLQLPFADAYFDGASCISVLEHMLAFSANSRLILEGSINEMLRVLRKGGLLILTFDVNFGKERRSLTLGEFSELCSILGIENAPLPPDRLFSSDTKEGLIMGRDLAVYSVTLTKG